MDQQIWQWTLTKDAIAPCFVRDVLDMRRHANRAFDFFWLGHTPCRTVLLVGMVVGVQVYDKRTIYTIDDGTAVIDCVLRHSHTSAPRSPSKSGTKTNPSSPKKAHLGRARLLTHVSVDPPPPITQPGYPVRVVGKVSRHYESKQIHADTIDTCPSTLDEIVHLENVIELHKTKYSQAVPFVPPPKPASRVPLNMSTPQAGVDADVSVFSSASTSLRPRQGGSTYTLPTPPHMPMPLQNRNRPPAIPTYAQYTDSGYAHAPSSPTASSIASSTPSSPCKPSSPVKANEAPSKPKLRHPSRLHTRDLTANTFRLYVKHYMDNAPPFLVSCPSPLRSTCGGVITTSQKSSETTPTKRARDESGDEPTPRPRPLQNGTRTDNNDTDYEDKDGSNLGFTLSHLRRVPELALLAARVVRAEARKRDKGHRDKEQGNSRVTSSVSLKRPNGRGEETKSTLRTGTGIAADPPRKKMRRLFSWAVVKLYEEGSIVLWDGDVRPLPVPPPPALGKEGDGDGSGLWNRGDDTLSTVSDLSYTAASVLYMSSASAPLYSHYHAPRRSSNSRHGDVVDADMDPAQLSDPPADEEAYTPLTPRFLAGYVREVLGAMRGCGNHHDRKDGVAVSGRAGRKGNEATLTPADIVAYMQRTDTRWARLGTWAVEEALAVLRTE